MTNFSVHSVAFDAAQFTNAKFEALLVIPPRGVFFNGRKITQSPLFPVAEHVYTGPNRDKGSYTGVTIQDTMSEGSLILEYAFDNGLSLSWIELVKKELAHLVPAELRPPANATTLNEVRNISKIFFWNLKVHSQVSSDDALFRVQAGIVNLFKSLQRLQKEHQVYFCLPDHERRNCWQVEKWLWDNSLDRDHAEAKKDHSVFFYVPPSGDKNVLVESEKNSRFDFLNGCWDLEDKSFCFHDLYRHYAAIFENRNLFHAATQLVGLQEINLAVDSGNQTRQVKIYDHVSPTQVYSFLRHQNFRIHTNLTVYKINNSKAKPQVKIEQGADGKLEQSISLLLTSDDDKTLDIPLPEEIRRWQLGLLGGLGNFMGKSHLDLASRKKDKRKYELKLFKHPGIFSYIVLEVLHNLFLGKTVEGVESLSQEQLKDYILKKISPLLHPEGLATEVLLSIPTIRAVREFIDQIYACFESTLELFVYHDLKIYDFKLQQKENFKLVFTQLKAIAEGQHMMAFRREKHAIWEQDELNTIFQMPSDWGTLSDWITILQEYNLPLQFNNQELNRLQEGDIEFKLDVAMNKEPGQRDWFSLHPAVYFGGVEIPAENVMTVANSKIFEHQGKLYVIDLKQIPKMKTLMHLWGKVFAIKGKHQKRESKYLKIPKSQFLELMALESMGVKISGDQEWKDIKKNFAKIIKRVDLDPEIIADPILKDYQQHGVQWLRDLYSIHLGGILADDMGLGKTLQILKFLENLPESVKHNILIVVPPSLLHNWDNERNKFTPSLSLQFFNPSLKSELLDPETQKVKIPGMLIVTYGLLTEHKDFFTQQSWNIIIFDEAQALKNIKSQRTTVARQLNANFKMALTGTPMENRLQEFYSLVDLVVPGALGDLSDFVQRYASGEEIGMDLSTLKAVVRPLLLRRVKSEVQLQLPEKIESTVVLPLEEEQKKIYKNIALSMNKEVEQSIQVQGVENSQLKMLVALLRLRQVCSDPRGVPNVKYTSTPAKFDYIVEKIDEVVQSGNSCLVFTQFLSTFENLIKEFKKINVPVYSICGADSALQRKQTLTAFDSSPEASVLVMTLKTGGVGLNLTKASYVFHIEPWWNPAVENQATDRAHRLGQNKTVNVYRLILKDTLEEKIQNLKLDKAKLFNQLFTDNEQGNLTKASGMLTKDDFKFLIGDSIKDS